MDRQIEAAQHCFENETEDLMQLSALELAAQIWTKPTTSHIPMDAALCEEIARLITKMRVKRIHEFGCRQDLNNYYEILSILGMEEEGNPVTEVERLKEVEEGNFRLLADVDLLKNIVAGAIRGYVTGHHGILESALEVGERFLIASKIESTGKPA